jgi:hypothetical protein
LSAAEADSASAALTAVTQKLVSEARRWLAREKPTARAE